MTTIAVQTRAVTVGVDTHKDTHVAAVLDEVGRMLGSCGFPTDPAGNAALIRWLRNTARSPRSGSRGTGSYGAQLSRDLQQAWHHVIEVDRPDRKARRLHGKDDHLDAEAAARAVLSGRAATIPKARDDHIEAIRALRVARRSTVAGRTTAMNQIKALLVSAPRDLREQLRGLSSSQLITTAARLRPDDDLAEPANATKYAMREIALRHQFLTAQLKRLDLALQPLVTAAAPALVARFAVGTDTAGALLVAVGDNPRPAAQRKLVRAPVRRRPAPPPAARPAAATASTAAVTVVPTTRSGGSSWSRWDRPADPGLRRQTHHPRHEQARIHALPQALRRPRGLRRPDRLRDLTSYRRFSRLRVAVRGPGSRGGLLTHGRR